VQETAWQGTWLVYLWPKKPPRTCRMSPLRVCAGNSTKAYLGKPPEKLRRLLVLCAFALLLQTIFWARPASCEDDPWYCDADVHWSGRYIYVLWLERVTDGFVTSWGGYYRAYFDPDDPCTRAQFAVLLAKVFGLSPLTPDYPSYPDVPKNYYILSYKPAWAWIEAATASGITFVPRGRMFYPDMSMTREDAVELLIRSLDLYEHAQSLPAEEVVALLTRFSDGMLTSPERRNSMACAIKYGIIDGYQDNTLRPQNTLLRCHAATIVYRSCLIRMDGDKDTVTPDGDGIDETVTFRLTYLQNRGISNWDAVIQDSNLSTVYSFNSRSIPGSPPKSLTWDGKNLAGNPVPSGRYYYQAMVRDRDGRQFFSVRRPLDVYRHRLWGNLYPGSCSDNEVLSVRAFTEPGARYVYGIFRDNILRYFSPEDSSRTKWFLQLTIGPFLPEGQQDVSVSAVFPNTSRSMTLSFTRRDSLWLDPWISPNPAGWGQELDLSCETSTNAEEVRVEILGAELSMVRIGFSGTGGLTWRSSYQVPQNTPEGEYPAVFTARSGQRECREAVLLRVETSKLRDLLFILVK